MITPKTIPTISLFVPLYAVEVISYSLLLSNLQHKLPLLLMQ
ncbi:hypothetical protein NT07LI_4059, partial [Listeria innocua FSL S4-378]